MQADKAKVIEALKDAKPNIKLTLRREGVNIQAVLSVPDGQGVGIGLNHVNGKNMIESMKAGGVAASSVSRPLQRYVSRQVVSRQACAVRRADMVGSAHTLPLGRNTHQLAGCLKGWR